MWRHEGSACPRPVPVVRFTSDLGDDGHHGVSPRHRIGDALAGGMFAVGRLARTPTRGMAIRLVGGRRG